MKKGDFTDIGRVGTISSVDKGRKFSDVPLSAAAAVQVGAVFPRGPSGGDQTAGDGGQQGH